jgi:hypothetical protein
VPDGRSLHVLLDRARREDAAHRAAHQKPISAALLRVRLRIGAARARQLVKIVRAEGQPEVCGDPVDEARSRRGSPMHPADVTARFQELVRQAGLPPIRLHDLRHGAATLALTAGADMKVVQAMLRHSSITVTSDIYTTVLPEVALAAAEATAKIVPRTATRQLGHISGSSPTIVDGREAEAMIPDNTKTQVEEVFDLGSEGAPSGTRTPNPLVKRTRFGVSGGAE